MNYKIRYAALALLGMTILASCSKNKDVTGGGGSSAASGAIKAALPDGMLFGLAVDYNLMANNPTYAATVANEANSVTFGNELKYGSVVQNDGSFNFTTADALYNLCSNAGLQVYGHNLVWYQQQNTVYLTSIVGSSVSANVLSNGGFENWSSAGSAPDGYRYANGATYFSQATGAANVHSGNYALAVSGYGANGGSGWHVQFAIPVPTISGHKYTISFWAKATGTGVAGGPGSPNDGNCYWQGEWDNGGSASYTGDQPITSKSWTQYTMKFGGSSITAPANKTSTVMTFDMGTVGVGQTVWLDDVVVNDYTQDSTNAANNSNPALTAASLNTVLKSWINAAVSRYAGKIKAWDVLNEPLADDGTIRTNANSPKGSGIFVWSNYLGKGVGVTAFNAAHAADPNALLFVNDYGLESNGKKLDSLIAYVKWMQDQGAHIDGIGTQMHIAITTPRASMDYMFKKLAATGLKIRISELDVKVNPSSIFGFALTPAVLSYQEKTYHDVVASYLANVPAAQRYGITVWGVDDPHSWLYNNGQDYPLLFDSSFAKKPAYSGILQALKGQ